MKRGRRFLAALVLAGCRATAREGGPGDVAADPAVRVLAQADGATPEADVAAALDAVRVGRRGDADAAAALTALLPENAALYQGRGAEEVRQLRGYVLATLADVGPPDQALPHIAAELRHGHDPYRVAAAARAAGALGDRARALAPDMRWYLGSSFKDDSVCLDRYRPAWPVEHPTTARAEIERALARIEACPCRTDAAAPGDGTGTVVEPWRPPSARLPHGLDATPMVDHREQPFRFGDLRGKPFALTFFYTRCENPSRCSLTVTRLGELNEILRARGLHDRVRLVAVTFDPRFDLPPVMRRYAEDRGFVLDDSARCVRIPDDDAFVSFLRSLDVGVSLQDGLVTSHGVELLLFDRNGRYVRRYDRVLWSGQPLLRDLATLARER